MEQPASRTTIATTQRDFTRGALALRRRPETGSDIGFHQSAVLLHPRTATGGFALAH